MGACRMKLLVDGFQDQTTDTGEVEIGYSVGPDNGPQLLLLHGVTSRRDGFVRVIDKLMPSYRIITMDQRGHGFSGHVPGAYGRADHARDIRHVLAATNCHHVVPVGTSLGAMLTMGMGAAMPTMLAGAILNDAGPELDPSGIARILDYVGDETAYDDWDAATARVEKELLILTGAKIVARSSRAASVVP